ncbi:GLPGLI family protein [Chitinophaga eiseniae]|uniref:GLPGLI family protein n=1 Tax=Chitinophaga eiseniae TaxID=634771 RepID=A0A847SMJ1_9BACT|nr:GLPGLI family protein [Chitinophaga eiseniae]NLR78586.1 GLPGLI family protein [Chitinophaga eiseniae]
MKKMMIFFFLICTNVFGQVSPFKCSIEVIYKMTYQPDSTNDLSRSSEYMGLFVGDSCSLFQSINSYYTDSAMYAENTKGNAIGPSVSFYNDNPTKFRYHVLKTQEGIHTYDRFSSVVALLYKYSEERYIFQWNVLNDTTTIATLHCQKAETVFGNRKWYAWFAPDIPVSDGPYKFSGLPGLIVKISDSQNYWNFDLISISNVDRVIRPYYYKSPLRLKNKEEFFHLKEKYQKNPLEMDEASGRISIMSGREAYSKRAQEKAKADNNWIEIYHYRNR